MVRLGLMGTPASRSVVTVERRLDMAADEDDKKKYGTPYRYV